MKSMKPSGSLEPRVARLEGQLEQIIETVNELKQSNERGFAGISAKIETLNRDARPNFGLFAQWSIVILVFVGMVATPIAYYFNTSILGLDTKLQKEYQLVNQTIQERVDGFQKDFSDIKLYGSPVIRERLTRVETKQEVLWNGVIKDLDELRERRMKDHAK